MIVYIWFGEGLKVQSPTEKISEDLLNFSVRTNTASDYNMIASKTAAGNSKCFWVAKPDIASVAPQIFYFENDDTAYPVNPISITDDSENPVLNTIADFIYISLPDEIPIKWNTADDYIIKEGGNTNAVSSIVNLFE